MPPHAEIVTHSCDAVSTTVDEIDYNQNKQNQYERAPSHSSLESSSSSSSNDISSDRKRSKSHRSYKTKKPTSSRKKPPSISSLSSSSSSSLSSPSSSIDSRKTSSKHKKKKCSRSSNTKRRKRDRVVSFASSTEVCEIDHINDLKQEMDISKIWYTKEEFQEINCDCLDSIICYIQYQRENDQQQEESVNDENNADDLLHIRGLEMEVENVSAKLEELQSQQQELQDKEDDITTIGRPRRSYITNSIAAVIEEQALQRDEKITNDELLADIYYNCSYKCQMDAESIAMNDYKQALLLLD